MNDNIKHTSYVLVFTSINKELNNDTITKIEKYRKKVEDTTIFLFNNAYDIPIKHNRLSSSSLIILFSVIPSIL
ncbi:hypothetical protein PFFVO_02186 [Plasmodium falciparum Vietnam Oak-Knoll (FVO)]|uniref:Uncharacterized protein n=1 Tax=Plasmodium falciparum Vietnam Oak-Knoll (FVO) TaxID=1036723 RepID=A0A024V921_PLAFA|nr:hypothetical protein PFFVO_02186 [Plasmodium falciparum Vietnam Oak-Knoll (FVO)]